MPPAPSDQHASERLDRPPRADRYLHLPDSFGRRFIIFVDTEEEFDWSKPHSRQERSTKAAEALPRIHRRLRNCGASPVYLIDHPIATDSGCVATLREFQDAGECVVGTQLHPWVNPPFEEELNDRNSFVGNLPVELERAKLTRLTDTIESAFGRRPTVYRAGRYGVGPNTALLLRELGYSVDVSVRALFDYSEEGGPDFSRIKPIPYWIVEGELLEIPLSAAFVGALSSRGSALYGATRSMPFVTSVLARAGLLSRVALTPEGMPLAEVITAVDRLLDQDVRLFSISFHSPSVVPGNTPYVKTEADLDRFYAWWDGIFDHFARRGIAPAGLDDVMAAAHGASTAAR